MGRIDVTYEEHARLKYRRYRGLDQFKVIGWVLLNCCLLSITVGIVILVIGRDVNNFPIPSGSPIWSGIMVIFVCVFAFVLGCYNPHFFHTKDSTKLFTWLYVYIVMAVIGLILCIISLGLTIHGTVVCGRNRGNTGQLLLYCGYNYDVQLVMNVTASLLSIFEIIFMIYGIVLYFIYKDAFLFYEWENAYYDEYYYTVPRGEHRYVERYITSDTEPVVTGEVDYVTTTSEKPRIEVVEGSAYSHEKSDMKGANVVSEYNTSNHRYLVLRFDRNQVRPIN